jgi:hypothetical protein
MDRDGRRSCPSSISSCHRWVSERSRDSMPMLSGGRSSRSKSEKSTLYHPDFPRRYFLICILLSWFQLIRSEQHVRSAALCCNVCCKMCDHCADGRHAPSRHTAARLLRTAPAAPTAARAVPTYLPPPDNHTKPPRLCLYCLFALHPLEILALIRPHLRLAV